MGRLKASVRRAILSIDGVMESGGVFTDEDAFWVNGSQIACWAGDDGIQLRLTQPVIRENREWLKDDPRIAFRGKGSPGINVTFRSNADVAFVAELALLAADAHRPAAGVAAKPPPIGADLERRRRFH